MAWPVLPRRQRVFLGGLHGLPPTSGRSMNCSAAIACCAAARSCRAKPYIGSLAVSMALQRLRQLSASMCRRDGVGGGAVQRHGRCGVRGCGLNGQRGGGGGSRAGGGQHQKKAGRWPWREKRCSWFRAPCRDFETTCTAFSSTKQVDGMLKTRKQSCGQPYG